MDHQYLRMYRLRYLILAQSNMVSTPKVPDFINCNFSKNGHRIITFQKKIYDHVNYKLFLTITINNNFIQPFISL